MIMRWPPAMVHQLPVADLTFPTRHPTDFRAYMVSAAEFETSRRDRFGVFFNLSAYIRCIGHTGCIRDLCREHRVAEPVIEVSDSWVTTAFHRPASELSTRTGFKQGSGKSRGTKSAPSWHQVEILRNCLTGKAIRTLMTSVSRKDRTWF